MEQQEAIGATEKREREKEFICKRCKQNYTASSNNPTSCRFHPSFFVCRRHDDQKRYGLQYDTLFFFFCSWFLWSIVPLLDGLCPNSLLVIAFEDLRLFPPLLLLLVLFRFLKMIRNTVGIQIPGFLNAWAWIYVGEFFSLLWWNLEGWGRFRVKSYNEKKKKERKVKSFSVV